MKYFFIFLFFFFTLATNFSTAQRGKDGAVTIGAASTVVNTYTHALQNANAGDMFIRVGNNTMTGSGFTTPLQQGDLVMIIQMQGIVAWPWDGGNLNIYTYDASVANGIGTFASTKVSSHVATSYQNAHRFGRIGEYGTAGNYELREVLFVSNNGGQPNIHFTCGLENTYEEYGKVQVVRVPRYASLTIAGSNSIICPSWNGTTGGVIAIEVDGTFTNSNLAGGINATGRGFRGGSASNTSIVGTNVVHTQGDGNGNTELGSNNPLWGGEIGESIAGDKTRYSTFFSMYGRGAIANGGGGGGMQNSGGGGGANVGDTTGHNGKGRPRAGYNAYWNAEKANMATTFSSGGGRGGYSYSNNAANMLNGPNNTIWGGDARKENGGMGGHALVYRAHKMFAGGGGGAGGQDSGQAGSGGNGGGIIHLTLYGAVTPTPGTIVANGANGSDSNPNNQTAGWGERKGNDGAGGGGGGGFITIKTVNPLPANLNLLANGGNGGTNKVSVGFSGGGQELCGPGAGGAGGGISITSGTPNRTTAGGNAGGTTHGGGQNTMSAAFPMNGATDGGFGLALLNNTTYDLNASNASVCGNSSATLTATVTGTLPAGGVIGWYTSQTSSTTVHTGSTFTTPNLSTTTTYYVGVCPGTFRKPVTVTVSAAPVINGTPAITHATCSGSGSITGLTVSGGNGPYTYSWNGTITPTPDLTNASANSYTLIVTDANGCTAQRGPFVINGSGLPTITGSPVIAHETCTTTGSITGLTASGPAAIDTYTWNGVTSVDEDLTGATAGSYTLLVTDVNGCTAQSGPHQINLLAGPTLSGTVLVTNENCNNGGTISGITVSGGVTPYSYSWTNSAETTINLSNGTAGTYTLTVSDANDCEVTSGPHQINLDSAPTITGTATLTQPSCTTQGAINGLSVSGGTGTLTYEWNGNTEGGPTLSNLGAGSYTLVVTDENACSATSGPYVLHAFTTPTIVGPAIVSPITCTAQGSIEGLTINNGTAPFSMAWNATPVTVIDLETSVPGNYTLNIVDANGCTAQSGPHNIQLASVPTLPGVDQITNENCHGLGEIEMLPVNGGVGPFTFSWSNSTETTLNLTNAAAGQYTLTLTDANGCIVTSGPHEVELDSEPVISGTAVITDATCTTTGSITGLTATGGVGTLVYEWNNIDFPGPDLTNASANTYVLVVTDANGCLDQSQPYIIAVTDGPVIGGTAVVQPITCTTDGQITGLTVTGGTEPYTYSFNGTVTTGPTFTTSTPGNYALTVVDDNGCTITGAVNVVSEIAPPTFGGTAVITDVTCDTGGSISGITVNGGTQPYEYAWNGVAAGSTSMTDLPAGTYTLQVTDDNGCVISSGPHQVGTSGNIPTIIGAPNVVHATCVTNGSISGLTVTGGDAPYIFEWNGEVTPDANLTDAEPGSYVLLVEDANGCEVTSLPIIIQAPDLPVIGGTANVVNANCLAGGSVTGLVISNGTAPYTYSWNGGAYTTLNLTNVPAATYTLTVTDANDCSVTGIAVVVGEDVLIDAMFSYSPQPVMINELVTFHDESIGNIIQWSWTIDTLNVASQHPNYTFTVDGFYPVTLEVMDANGCTDSITVTIEVISETIVPNIITANGDGINDFFVLKGLLPNTKLTIVNRWGNIIYVSDAYDNTWNGYDMSGNKVTEGVYTYTVTLQDGNQKHGFVHVVHTK